MKSSNRSLRAAAAILFAAGSFINVASAQSLTTTTSNNGSGGVYMDLTPTGASLDITSFEVYFTGTAGTTVPIEIWTRSGTYAGHETNPSGWMLHQTVTATRAGTTALAPITLNFPLELPAGITTGILLQATESSGIRYHGTNANPPQTQWANADLSLYSEHATTSATAFGGSIFSPRTFAGVINYTPGGPAIAGACCFDDGTCQSLLGADCFTQGGVFQGGGTECANVSCPPIGACCLSDGSCIITWETTCNSEGGLYQGDGSECQNITCPQWITTTFASTSSATNSEGPGAYFKITALDHRGIIVEHFEINTPAAAGTPITAHVYFRPETFVGYTGDASAWTLLGEVQVTSAGQNNPTLVPIGGLPIEEQQTYALRVGVTGPGGIRYNSNTTTPPTYANSHVELTMGEVQNNFFGSTTFGTYPTSLRGFSGSVYYSLGTEPCYADCDVNGTLNVDDFLCFINEFAQAQSLPVSQQIEHYANCTGTTAAPILTVDDFLCFINAFSQGCE